MHGVGNGPDEPGVDGQALGPGPLLGLGLERLGQPEGDPGGAAVVVELGGRCAGGGRVGGRLVGDHDRQHDHLGLAAVHADLDRAGVAERR